MARREQDFKDADKVRMLLWCERHCCLCGKFAGVGIEIAHIDQEKKSRDINDAIPVCFDCHAAIGHYDPKHPRGRKYSPHELRARRDQVYERHTYHLAPPVQYAVTAHSKGFPNVGFTIRHLSDTWPVKARISLTVLQGAKNFGAPFHPDTAQVHPHYDGTYLWNLNPRHGMTGWFVLPEGVPVRGQGKPKPLRIRVEVSLIDIYGRSHDLLPVGYMHRLRDGDNWYYEPSEDELRASE